MGDFSETKGKKSTSVPSQAEAGPSAVAESPSTVVKSSAVKSPYVHLVLILLWQFWQIYSSSPMAISCLTLCSWLLSMYVKLYLECTILTILKPDIALLEMTRSLRCMYVHVFGAQTPNLIPAVPQYILSLHFLGCVRLKDGGWGRVLLHNVT